MRLRLVVLSAVAVCAAPASAHAAEQLAVLTDDGQIALVRSDSPGAIRYSVAIRGLRTDEKVLGIDTRPGESRLIALTSGSRIVRIDLATGRVDPVSNTRFSPPLNGATAAFSLDPTTNALRVVTDTRQNLLINAFTGQVLASQPGFAYTPEDPAAGTMPALGAVAFSNAVPGATSSTLYAIDTTRGTLVQNTSELALRTVGPLGGDAFTRAGFDIGTDGTAYAALVPGSATAATPLDVVDLSTGTAAPVRTEEGLATIAPRLRNSATKRSAVVALSALGEVPDDTDKPSVSTAVSARQGEAALLRDGNLRASVSCDEACTIAATVRVGTDTSTATGSVVGSAGTTRLRIRLTAAQRAIMRRGGESRLRLALVVRDAAANSVRLSRTVVAQ